MKLFLSSYLIPDTKAFADFVGKEPADTKIGLVFNAKDYRPEEYRTEKRTMITKYFASRGFAIEIINLLDHPKGEGLLETFKRFDVVWFCGGNTFSLRYAIEESNCISILKQALAEGVIYAGDSAGAIAAGPTLRHFEMVDDATLPPRIIEEGMHLVDFAILPHWDSPDYVNELPEIERNLQVEGFTTMRLLDSEYVLVENGEVLNK